MSNASWQSQESMASSWQAVMLLQGVFGLGPSNVTAACVGFSSTAFYGLVLIVGYSFS